MNAEPRPIRKATWEATITPPEGRWGPWFISMNRGISMVERGWFVYGRERAERKAQRLVDKFTEQDARCERERFTVRPSA